MSDLAPAGANIAAVNYHFHSKEDLYVGAWRHSFHESPEAHPPNGDVGSDGPPSRPMPGPQARVLAGEPTAQCPA